MKTSSSFLHDLVLTLTKSEKRYVKVQAGNGAKDYIHLMDALLAQKSYDEEKLAEDNKGANFLKHLAVNKRYLYELLLKSLTQFGKKTVEDNVQESIDAANILIKKGLFQAAFNELKKGQKVAEKYELFELQIALCGIHKKLLSQQQFIKQNESDVQEIFNLEMNSLEQIKNTNEYWHLAQQIALFQMQFQKIQNEAQQKHLDRLIQSPLFHNQDLATNFKSKLYFFQANSTYQFMMGKVEQAYETNRSSLDFLDANPQFFKIYAERYLSTLNNMLIDSLVIGKYDILKAGINRLLKVIERPEFKSIKNIETWAFRQRYLLLLNWSLSQKDFDRALEYIPKIEAGLEQFGKKIEKHHRITFYYLIAYLLFLNGQYDRALKWNNFIINDRKENVVKEIFHFSRILNLLIHYELGNYNLLESLLQSTPKYLKARRAIYTTEKALFRFLGKMTNNFDKKDKEKRMTDFKNEINELYKKPTEKRVFNYIDLRLWMDK